MRYLIASLLCCALLFGVQPAARAQDTVIPAGTLLRCTMDEPNFSTATVSVGDPVVCHLSSLQMYGRNVFPRGSYLGGHLEDAKEPGHFWGKGSLQLQFDRIGFPTNGDIPVPSKVIAAKGYKVNKEGDIVGKGHAKRDVVEWLIPPLWPWKIIMLPARGPRPTLKGEEQITLRLMDDIVMPKYSASNSNNRPPYYRPQPSYDRLSSNRPPEAYPAQADDQPAVVSRNVESRNAGTTSELAAAPQASSPDPAMVQAAVSSTSTMAPAIREAEPNSTVTPVPETDQHLTVVALKTGELFAVASYRMDGEILNYTLAGGTEGGVETQDVDWRRTSQMNARQIQLPLSTGHTY
jgi:hypothetical protein